MPGNKKCQVSKQKVPYNESKVFQISGPGEQSAETALSKGLTKEYSLDYRAIYACKQQKTMGKKVIYSVILELFVNFAALLQTL